MNNTKIKCSLPKHNNYYAISYCPECKIYMCKNCLNIHSDLCIKHHSYKIDQNINNIFTGFCQKKNHYDKLEFYCKTHNELCCSGCISMIKKEGKGEHTDCDVCVIEDIKNEKKENLENNIQTLETLSNNLQESIDKLRRIFAEINENKEEIKINIQQTFIKIRNIINEREIEILKEVDNQFNELFFKEDFLKQSENLPKEVLKVLQKGKQIKNDWNNDKKLILLINECLDIEKNIENINEINENIENFNSKNIKIKFQPKVDDENEELNNFLETIKSFGKIYYIDYKYIFKRCPLNINENKKYIISGEEENILTKLGKTQEWVGTICNKELERNKKHTWKIKVLNTQNYNIMVGVAPIDFDVNSSDHKSGWFYNISNFCLYSGPPYNYNSKESGVQDSQEELTVILDLCERTLNFQYEGNEFYNNIPIDKPLAPAVLLYDENDSVEIIDEENLNIYLNKNFLEYIKKY